MTVEVTEIVESEVDDQEASASETTVQQQPTAPETTTQQQPTVEKTTPTQKADVTSKAADKDSLAVVMFQLLEMMKQVMEHRNFQSQLSKGCRCSCRWCNYLCYV